MMAAIRAARAQHTVTLFEQSADPGRKILLSGKGRCNLTNTCDLDAFLCRFSRSGPFLRNAFSCFFNRELMRFFETRGVALKVERQGRVFPVSNSSAVILAALTQELTLRKVKVRVNTRVARVYVRDGTAGGIVLEDGTRIAAERVICAVGGLSYLRQGSAGRPWSIAASTGHTLRAPRPGLVGLRVAGKHPLGLAGLTLKNIRLKFGCEGRKLESPVGELLFTHCGISGPLVFSYSGRVDDWLTAGRRVSVDIDLKPGLEAAKLDERLRRDIAASARRQVKSLLKELLPRRMIGAVLKASGVDGSVQAGQLSKKERASLVSTLKRFTLPVSAAEGITRAMVTRGGVLLKEIDPRTMESRLVRGLYFAGEMIDVDADTGGFNLQAAFSTGYLAGQSAAS